MEGMEYLNRRNNIILSGDELSKESSDSCPKFAISNLLRSKLNYELPVSSILSANRLGSRPATQMPDKRNMLVKLIDFSLKKDVLVACKQIKPPNLFANDDLPPLKHKILFALRRAKREFPAKISACGSLDGKVYALLKSPNNAGNIRIFINTLHRLDDFFTRELKVSYVELIGDGSNN